LTRVQPKYDRIFNDLNPVNGKVSGSTAKNEMVKSKLPNSVRKSQKYPFFTCFQVLGKIWKLADHDKDGYLDDEEFSLAMHLIKVKLENNELPTRLPDHLVPPSQRDGNF